MGEKLALEIETKGGASIDKATDSLKQLKKELAAAKAAGLNGDGNAARRIAELTDRMDDLRDATRTMQGSGVEQAKSSLSMLGEGFKNLDFDKIKTAFKGLGSAMKAIPIFLLIEGISYLVEHFDELSKGTGPLAKALRFVGDALHWISDVIGTVVNYFTDMAGATSDATRALEVQGKAIKETSDKVNAALASQIKSFDNQIAIAKASGKSTVALEIAKQQAIIDTNLIIAKQIEAFVRAGGEFDDEKKKMLTASLDAIRGAKVTEQIIEITDHKAKQEAYKKHLEEVAKIREGYDAIDKRMAQDKKNDDAKRQAEEEKEEADIAAGRARVAQEIKDIELKQMQEATAEFIKNEDDKTAKAKEEAAKIAAAKQQIETQSFAAGKALSDTFFAIQLRSAKGNAAAELEIKKNQFKVDKAFSIARAVIDGVRSVQAALTIPPPFGFILAGINGALAAANVVKIASTQFDGGGGGGSVSAPSLPSGNTTAPTINNASNTPIQGSGSTNLDSNGNNLNVSVKAHVVETEVTSVQERINRLKSQASH